MGSRPVSGHHPPAPIVPGSVKIDGFRTVGHALMAAEAGAELIGMILAPARRQVTIETTRRITAAVHAAVPGVRLVGVFVDASVDDMNAAVRAAGLDLVQLHGDEPPGTLSKLDVGAIKAFRAMPGEDAATLASRIDAYLSAPVAPVAVLIDGYDSGAHGGTGVRADWTLVTELSGSLGFRVGLAGGLTPGNVHEAIMTVGPLMVDVSSGVEVDGIKDEALIRRFVEQADIAFSEPRVTPSPSGPFVRR